MTNEFTNKLDDLKTKSFFNIMESSLAKPSSLNTFILEHKQEVLTNIKNINKDLFLTKSYLIHLNKENYEGINNLINLIDEQITKNPLPYLQELITYYLKSHYDYKSQEFKSFVYLIAQGIIEVCTEEKVECKDIIFNFDDLLYAQMVVPFVVKINNIYLKITPFYKSFNMHHFPYLIASINRQDFTIAGQKIYLTVTPRVGTSNITKEDVYTVYKKVRDLGLVWTDPSVNNIGRLLEDNITNFKNFGPVPYENLGYIDSLGNDIILKKGDLVILDTDYIFKEDEPNIFYGQSNALEMEKRYQEERKMQVKR